MSSPVFEAVRLAYEHPILAPPLLLLILSLLVSPYAKYLWKNGRRGYEFWRPVLIAGLSLLFLGSVYGRICYRSYGIPPSFQKGEIGVLITKIPGEPPSQGQYQYAQTIRQKAEGEAELRGVVKVRTVDRLLPDDPEEQQAEALKVGRWVNAAFVIRPNVIAGVNEPFLTIVDQGEFLKPEIPLGRFGTAQLANLDTLPLPHDVLLLAKCTLAFSLWRRGSYRQASEMFDKVLASPDLPEGALNRALLNHVHGEVLLDSGDLDGAIVAYRKALALNPGLVNAHNGLGTALFLKAQYDEAIAEFRKTLGLKPDDPEAHNNLGAALGSKGQHDEAIAELRKALALKPDDAGTCKNLGIAFRHMGQYDEAIAEFRKALALKPDAETHDSIGFTLRDEGQDEQAPSSEGRWL